jgi:hypothetical protein
VLSGHGRAYLTFAPNASGRVCSICVERPANLVGQISPQVGVVMLIEDLHWVGSASEQLLGKIIDRGDQLTTGARPSS